MKLRLSGLAARPLPAETSHPSHLILNLVTLLKPFFSLLFFFFANMFPSYFKQTTTTKNGKSSIKIQGRKFLSLLIQSPAPVNPNFATYSPAQFLLPLLCRAIYVLKISKSAKNYKELLHRSFVLSLFRIQAAGDSSH